MPGIDLELLGMTREELQGRVVERISDALMNEQVDAWDDDTGQEYKDTVEKRAMTSLKKLIRARIDGKIEQLARQHIIPRIGEMIESLTLQETNKWGEKKKQEPVTFVEYLVARAEEYLREPVDYEGKPQGSGSSYSKKDQTRLTWLVHQHLSSSIASAMRDAVKTVNDTLVPALHETCKMQLKEIAGKLKIRVEGV